MQHEETGDAVLCPICGTKNYQECGHLMASFDRTFGDCEGGEFYETQASFRDAMSSAFETRRNSTTAGAFADKRIDALWPLAEFEVENDDGYYWVPFAPELTVFFIEILEQAGAVSAGSDIVHYGGLPGTSSAYTELFAPVPSVVISKTEKILSFGLRLQIEGGSE
jgi:hypothetical protein